MSDQSETPQASEGEGAAGPIGPDDLELVVEGDEQQVQGFIKGLFVGSSSTDWPVFNQEFGIEAEAFGETLKAWAGLSEHLTHFIIAAGSLELVTDALRDPRCPGLELRVVRPILGASFAFDFAVYNEELGTAVRDIFAKVPDGVEVADLQISEVRNEEDAGVELYTSAHDYELSGSGVVSGSFRDVLYVHEQARRVEQVSEVPLHLDLGEPTAP